jgi:Flp pilus assembly protein TadG
MSISQFTHSAKSAVHSFESPMALNAQKLKLSIQFSRNNRRGAAVLEFAFVAPLLFFLILGMIEFGRLMMVKQLLTNNAVVGARRAVLPSATDADVIAVVNNFCAAEGISGQTTTITTEAADSLGRIPVSVTVNLRYGDVSLIGDSGLDLLTGSMLGIDFSSVGSLKNKQVTATAVMRKEDKGD